MRHLSGEDLISLYYGEPDSPPDAAAHLAQCVECRAAADSLAQALDLCNQIAVPVPAPDFEQRVWRRAVGRRRPALIWMGLAAAAALLAAVFLHGELRSRPFRLPFQTGRGNGFSKSHWPTIWNAPTGC